MDAKGVEKQIRDKLDVIGDTIASFLCTDKSSIKKKLDRLNFYVYENYDSQKNRLIEIELRRVAREYANDVFDDIKLTKKKKEELWDRLTSIITNSKFVDDSVVNNSIDSFVRETAFKSMSDEIRDRITIAMNNFSRDYETKDILSMIHVGDYSSKDMEKLSLKVNSDILKEVFNINTYTSLDINWVWESFMAFALSDEDLENASDDYRKRIKKSQNDAYRCLDCNGNNEKEYKKDLKKRGLVLDKKMVAKLEGCYNYRLVKEGKHILNRYTNVFSIYNDLKSKGYTMEDFNIAYLFNNRSIYGVNFQIYGKGGQSSYIVFANNSAMYTSEFNDTCIHEIIHYLGGKDSLHSKIGLYYNDDKRYLDLEEAYVNAVSKRIKDIVVKKYGNIVEPSIPESHINYYDHTLEYMKVVLYNYLKELTTIHLSSIMSLEDANKLMPFNDVANSIYKIMNADDDNVEKYTREEIAKLSKKLNKKS
jgi:hypothetical protein